MYHKTFRLCRPTACTAPSSGFRSGFTLVELLVVISIITAIMAMTLPAISAIREGQRVTATEALVKQITTLIGTHGTDTTSVPTGGNVVIRMLWDFNDDGLLDGDPALDSGFSAADKTAAADAEYTGPLRMLGINVPDNSYDNEGRVLDAWGNVLRVTIYPTDTGRYNAWSVGPDG